MKLPGLAKLHLPASSAVFNAECMCIKLSAALVFTVCRLHIQAGQDAPDSKT